MLAYKAAEIDLIQTTNRDQGTTSAGIPKGKVYRDLWSLETHCPECGKNGIQEISQISNVKLASSD